MSGATDRFVCRLTRGWGCILIVLCYDCALLFQPIVQAAAPTQYIHRVWTREHGLPDNEVHAILQSRDGYLWLGTSRGLARFDGLRFTVFDHLTVSEMKSDDCLRLAEDPDGVLWIGTADGLLRKTGNVFTRFTVQDGLSSSRITALCASRRGGVWIGGDGGVSEFRHGHLFKCPEAPTAHYIAALFEDSMGALWIGTARGLDRFEPESRRTTRVGKPPELEPFGVVAIQSDGATGLWALFFYSGSQGVLYKFDQGHWQHLADGPSTASPPEPWNLFLTTDRYGQLWLPGAASDLISFRANLWNLWPLTSGSVSATNLVVSATEDRDGTLWLGTQKGGLCRWQPRKVQTLSSKDGLLHDNTWTLCGDRDGSVWIGTDGGLNQWHNGQFTHFTESDGLSRNTVRALAFDPSGTLWIGTGNGLNSFRGGHIERHTFSGQWFESKIRVVLPARDGSLWVGTAMGLHQLRDGQDIKLTTTNGLPADDVRALLADRAGNLWIGTSGGGLCKLGAAAPQDGADNGRARSAEAPFHPGRELQTFSITNGLASSSIWALHEDAEGVLWIGTESGLDRLKDGHFAVFTRSVGLPDDMVNCILEDDFGCLWISHDHGIYRVRKQALNQVADGTSRAVDCVSYDEDDGLLSVEANGQKSQPPGLKTHGGRLWFATTKGVVIFDPRNLPDNTNVPLVVIEQVRANGKLIFDTGPLAPVSSWSRGPGTSNAPQPPPSQIANQESTMHLLPGSAHILEIPYTACAFNAAEKNRFRYRLDGLDRDWLDVGTARKAYYANLRPGDYRFRVIAANKHGIWNPVGASFSFHLAPHFYETAWFFTVCGLALGVRALGVYGWRVREIRRIQRLESQMALLEERQRIAKDLHDGLGGNLTQLALLADLADSMPPDPQSFRERSEKLSRSSMPCATSSGLPSRPMTASKA
jgi:ligand-binding sensor domain-containing protein